VKQIKKNMKISKVKIKKSKSNDIKKSGYFGIFGDEQLADLFRKVQSTAIRNGNELQKIIFDEVTFTKFGESVSLDKVMEMINSGQNFYIPNFKISKSQFESATIKLEGKKNIDVDAIFFNDGILYIIEYKQGDNLDTKKSQSEVESLYKISKFFQYYNVVTSPKLVMWICDDVKNSSIKTTEHKDYLITGSEISEVLGISFDKVQQIRNSDQLDNIEFIKKEFEKFLNS